MYINKMAEFFYTTLNNFDNITKKPEKYLSCPDTLVDKIQKNVKEIYDFTKSQLRDTSYGLPTLILNNFDIEQIWQQIELQNDGFLNDSVNTVGKLIAAKDHLWFLEPEEEVITENVDDAVMNDSNDDLNESDDEVEMDSSNDEPLKDIDEDIDLEDEDEENENNFLNNEHEQTKKKKIRTSAADDDFFKLSEMEEFLKQAEKKETKKKNNDSDEESVDLFDSNLQDEDDEEESDEDETVANLRYKDYFKMNNENIEENDRSNDNEMDEDDKNDDMYADTENIHEINENKEINDEEMDDENENDNLNKDDDNVVEQKSSLEVRQERLKERIDKLEENALQEKSWQMKGEITASKRPQNSLLEEIVEFDLTSRPAPVVTEETTFALEDIIKQRIKDKAWDSVERKQKPQEFHQEYKKKLVLDQEKSKSSLAKIYEDEYLKQKEEIESDNKDKEEKVPEEHLQIKKMMNDLFSRLDTLSSYHFTPKIVKPDAIIINNLPAIMMEEVAPVATTDAQLLAPEEVKSKKTKGDPIGQAERTKTDKKRQRRQKKLKQKEHAKEKAKKEKLIEKLKPGLGNKYSKEKAKKLLDKVVKEKNVDKMDESLGRVKSSSAFFSQLQEQVHDHIKSKTKVHKNKTKPQFDAKKLKL